MQPIQKGTKVVTGEIRGSYVNVFRSRLNDLSGEHEYSLVVLVPKSDKSTVKALRAAADAAAEKKWGGKPPKKARPALRDGDDEEDRPESAGPEYEGHYFFNAKSKDRPGIVDKDRAPIDDPDQFMSGDYARLSLNAYGYEVKGNSGVAFGLNNIQVIRKGEPLSARARAEDEFDQIEVETEEGVEL